MSALRKQLSKGSLGGERSKEHWWGQLSANLFLAWSGHRSSHYVSWSIRQWLGIPGAITSPIDSNCPAVVGASSSPLQDQVASYGVDLIKVNIQITFFLHRVGKIGGRRGETNICKNS